MAENTATQSSNEALLASIYRDKVFCDATITCRGEHFPVHRIVVCLRSDYFREAFDGHFKESTSKLLDLPEEEPEIVRYCLDCLYLGKYTASDQADPIVHVQLYAAGDKFMIPELMKLARCHFNKALAAFKSVQVAPLSDLVSWVYNTAGPQADGLREDLLAYLHTNLSQLMVEQDFADLLQDRKGLAIDLLRTALSPPAVYCNSRYCKRVQKLRVIPACNSCGLSANLSRSASVNDKMIC